MLCNAVRSGPRVSSNACSESAAAGQIARKSWIAGASPLLKAFGTETGFFFLGFLEPVSVFFEFGSASVRGASDSSVVVAGGRGPLLDAVLFSAFVLVDLEGIVVVLGRFNFTAVPESVSTCSDLVTAAAYVVLTEVSAGELGLGGEVCTHTT